MFHQFVSQGLAAFGRGRNYAAAGPMTPARRGHRKQLCYHGAEGGGQLVDAARRGENEDLVAQRLGELAEHELQYLPVRLLREKRAVGGRLCSGPGDEVPELEVLFGAGQLGGLWAPSPVFHSPELTREGWGELGRVAAALHRPG